VAEYNITTIFGEKVEIGDEIMYMTVRHNDIIYSFAIVIDIEPYIDKSFADPQRWRLLVRRFASLEWSGLVKNEKLIYLRNPRIIKCNKELRSPVNESEKMLDV
jgi:hypothetical protein